MVGIDLLPKRLIFVVLRHQISTDEMLNDVDSDRIKHIQEDCVRFSIDDVMPGGIRRSQAACELQIVKFLTCFSNTVHHCAIEASNVVGFKLV